MSDRRFIVRKRAELNVKIGGIGSTIHNLKMIKLCAKLIFKSAPGKKKMGKHFCTTACKTKKLGGLHGRPETQRAR